VTEPERRNARGEDTAAVRDDAHVDEVNVGSTDPQVTGTARGHHPPPRRTPGGHPQGPGDRPLRRHLPGRPDLPAGAAVGRSRQVGPRQQPVPGRLHRNGRPDRQRHRLLLLLTKPSVVVNTAPRTRHPPSYADLSGVVRDVGSGWSPAVTTNFRGKRVRRQSILKQCGRDPRGLPIRCAGRCSNQRPYPLRVPAER
jgi:hypothetical protein